MGKIETLSQSDEGKEIEKEKIDMPKIQSDSAQIEAAKISDKEIERRKKADQQAIEKIRTDLELDETAAKEKEFTKEEWNELLILRDLEYVQLVLHGEIDRFRELEDKSIDIFGEDEVEKRFQEHDKQKGQEDAKRLRKLIDEMRSMRVEKSPGVLAREIPTEVFGTEKERQQNFQRIIEGFTRKRKEDLSPAEIPQREEEFQRRKLEINERFLEHMPLIHATSLESAVNIFKSGGITSAARIAEQWDDEKMISQTETGQRTTYLHNILERAKHLKEKKRNESHTRPNDSELGLNELVFASNAAYPYGDVFIVIDDKILERPDCLVTGEDMALIPPRLRDCFPEANVEKRPYLDWSRWTKEDFPEPFQECVKEYKGQVIPGRNFKELLSDFYATEFIDDQSIIHYSHYNPESEYLSYLGKHSYIDNQQRIPSFPRQWSAAEVKVRERISLEEINFVIVKSKEAADLLIQNGVSPEKIEVSDESLINTDEVRKIFSRRSKHEK